MGASLGGRQLRRSFCGTQWVPKPRNSSLVVSVVSNQTRPSPRTVSNRRRGVFCFYSSSSALVPSHLFWHKRQITTYSGPQRACDESQTMKASFLPRADRSKTPVGGCSNLWRGWRQCDPAAQFSH